MERVEKTNFPWLMSNVIDNETGQPLADGKVSHIVDWCGRKIGLVKPSSSNFFRDSFSKKTSSFLRLV